MKQTAQNNINSLEAINRILSSAGLDTEDETCQQMAGMLQSLITTHEQQAVERFGNWMFENADYADVQSPLGLQKGELMGWIKQFLEENPSA